jgi:TatA/E family protein of Tat protein translocase
MFGLSGQELLVIVILALVILGPKKLPEVAKTLGKGYQELRRAVDGVKGAINPGQVFSEMMKGDDERTGDKSSSDKKIEGPTGSGPDDSRELKG